jgi:hypothetical protein
MVIASSDKRQASNKRQGYFALDGQIIDVTIVDAPKRRLTAEESATIKSGDTPAWPKAKALLNADAIVSLPALAG